MRDTQLFQQALGVTDPWYVSRTEFDQAASRLDLYIDFASGATFACPECGAAGCKAHDTEEKTWRHLNFFQHEAYLHARTPRVRCARCGVRLVQVPWARPGSGFTLLFEALVMMLVKDMPVAAIARMVREHDTRLWRIVHHYVDQARAEADFSQVSHVGMDEKASRRGHRYLTLFVDLDESRLLFATETRESTTVTSFRNDLEQHGGDTTQIREFCLDMWPAYIKGIRDAFPAASMTFDKFHVMKLLNEAVDKVRRQEQRARPELKRSRYVWTTNPENLSPDQFALLDALNVRRLNLKTARAYHMRLAFQEFWSTQGQLAKQFLRRWYFWATHSRLQPMIDFARMLRRHEDGILRWTESRASNGVLEGINSLVQAAKAKARGYRSTRNLIAMAYLLAGKLNFRLLST
ncbi:MAG: ISL3 family transposase [Gemmatimonadota bacterium]